MDGYSLKGSHSLENSFTTCSYNTQTAIGFLIPVRYPLDDFLRKMSLDRNFSAAEDTKAEARIEILETKTILVATGCSALLTVLLDSLTCVRNMSDYIAHS